MIMKLVSVRMVAIMMADEWRQSGLGVSRPTEVTVKPLIGAADGWGRP
jgi:hypothetical protein